MKPNNQPVYINSQSNHPPHIIERIPSMIEDRINNISSSKKIFNRSAPIYNDALKASGFKETIKFKVKTEKPKRVRNRNITWFNPPFSMNVRTKVVKKFLNIVSKNFPKTHRLHKIFNRNTLKVSYSCMPNVSSIISSHNKKVLNGKTVDQSEKTCNCQKKNLCPLNGNCLDSQLIYQCNVRKNENENGMYYIGLTGNTFKDRWNGHNYTFRHEEKENSTELSKHIWEFQRQEIAPKLSWEVIDHARPYANGSKKCDLCLTEKYHIITSELPLLNKRSELVSKCRHINKYILDNYKSIPPDAPE